ncbi:arylamine N-acetyltransferase [Streptomyces sp. TX20-6-3]|uniref:arylamine N-acetyltransferase family protein n=1 Tax=Streptomyces sp. TX20-6-3 TaxID=3028705 RepID=UPI0029B0E73F|nr:arylamine N-acetyltransferase [Streptomyces sp. TX20-6-3]MDX2565251.1 arylamine N-acetyltransferase [Streptomyces sp. TX20-6-3]
MWDCEEFNLDAYLNRVGYRGRDVDSHWKNLKELNRAHVEAIDFDNIDILLGKEISLHVGDIQDKICNRMRGGYCYEQNSLFAAALERMGYSVTGHGSRNLLHGNPLAAVTHAFLTVELDGERWLVDTAFGRMGPYGPVNLSGAPAEQSGWLFKTCENDGTFRLLRSPDGGSWTALYSFTLQASYPSDFAVMHHYSSTHQHSKFVNGLVLQKFSSGTFLKINGSEQSKQTPEGTVKRQLTRHSLTRALEQDFGMTLTGEEVSTLTALL